MAAITTSAVRRDGGYLLSGSKSHITNAPVADLMLIVGRVPEAGGHDITLFVIDAGQPGVERGMERLCVTAVAPHLRPGQMTVGVSVEMRHLAPTPVGEKVEFHITTALTGRRFTVTFTAADPAGRVLATGTHDRAIVDEAAFRARIGAPAS
ncbi:hypothetical protein GCM10009678_81980 [Actinomadura kijaniata]|nr:acyl-CoA dehydrogenase family protein [Actinomadura namibiensis]